MRGYPLHACLLGFLLPLVAAQAQNLPLGAVVNRSGSTITGVTFRVWAPNATSVAVRGQFNSWGETAMLKDEATGYWTATVAAARPGHEYKYFIRWTGNSGGTWKHDPRVVQLRNGNSVVYDHEAFDWGDAPRPSIPVDRQVMYEMHVGSFHDPDTGNGRPGTFDDAIARLDYLARLGVNVIALMPVNEFGSDYSWGYNPEHLFAVESAYGGPDGLKRFVRAAHQLGIKVQLDVVHNHWNAPGDGVWEFDGPGNIYFYADARRRWTPWGSRPDYSKPEVRRYIQDNIRMFLDEFRIDGFRWDSPQNILGFNWDSNSTNPDNVLSEGKLLMTGINRMINEEYPGCWSIAEDSDLLSVVPNGYYWSGSFYDSLRVTSQEDSFDGHWQTSFHNEVTPQIASSSPNVQSILNKVNGWSEPPGFRVIFTDNHDKSGSLNNSTRLANRMDAADPGGRTARRKTLLNAVLTLTAPGTPMLFMGQEFHATGAFNDAQPIAWNAALAQHRVFRAHRDLVTLRETLPALQNADLSEAPGGLNENLDVIVYWRRADNVAANDVVICMNFSGETRTNFNVQFPSSGTWHVRMNTDWTVYGEDFGNAGPSQTVNVGGNNQAGITIPPHSAIILARSPAPEGVSSDDSDGNGLPDGWEAMTGTSDPDGDPDDDGVSNLVEYQMGFDPHVPNPATVAGTFNGWNAGAAPLRATGTVSGQVEYIRSSLEGGAWEVKFIFAGQWYGISGQPNLGAEDNIVFNVPAGNYVRLVFNTISKTHSVATFGTSSALMVDADGDGMDDRWEGYHGLTSPSANPDGDAFPNLQEFLRGSDPNAWNRQVVALAGAYNSWNAGANALTFAGNTAWIIDLPFPGGTSGLFKFTDGTWNNAWGDPGNSPDQNILINFNQGPGIYRFTFDERDLFWQVSHDATDGDGDGMQDEWERHFNVGDPAGDPDNDAIRNLAEFRRGSSPHITDRMSLVGSSNPLSWDPDAQVSRMAWSDGRQRWEWSGTFAAGSLDFKFASGPGWTGTNYGTAAGVPAGVALTTGGDNLSSTLTAGRRRFSFNEFSGAYAIEAVSQADEWRQAFGLDEGGDWADDSDGDGFGDVAEYALGGDPRDAADASGLKLFTVVDLGGGGRGMAIRWLQRTDDAALQVIPFVSDALGDPEGWLPAESSVAPDQNGVPSGFQRRQVVFPLSAGARFLRLQVQGL
ncbi:MAG: alpha amylase C-terminal domain-containing protein [Chthoniobacterales bacterium]|nr:alpha amylase C-terminal domain-containing protein [Chthoniobacterales bacterium]